ncbi:MAG: SLBB domain-containing protein [candidate division KSB1 bacterium]|nr:SLBB domain-containing protein [candidate division KSB1 bacterium]
MKRIVVLLLLLQPFFLSAAEEVPFVFKKADGFKLLIYDNNMEVERNRILSAFHNVDFVIDGEGNIQLGAFGKIKIEGLTVDKATKAVYEKLQPYGRDIMIVIIPTIRLIIRGEVGSPGMYRISPNTSFWDFLSQAGGVTNSFALENMYVIRNGEILYANFMDALYKGVSVQELGLESGDEIIAPRINRLSFYTIIRYANFISSMIILYITISNRNNK